MKRFLIISVFLLSNTCLAEENINTQAVSQNTTSYSATAVFGNVDLYVVQAEGTFALSKSFGATLAINNMTVNAQYSNNSAQDSVQNARVGLFYRQANIGRVELAYQQLFVNGNNRGFYSATGEYYFQNWTLGSYFLSDDNMNFSGLNLYSNVYFTDNIRLDLDLLDASDNSLFSTTLRFQLPEYINRQWEFNLSFGKQLLRDNQWGIGVKYTPNFDNSLKSFYRKYSTNIKSLFFQ